MLAAAHSPEFARKVGIKPSVAKEFVSADKAAGKYQKKRVSAHMKKRA